VRNTTIKRDLELPSVVDEVARQSKRHLDKLEAHANPLASRVLEEQR